MPALATFLLLSLAGLPDGIAQPVITKQPTSIAVALGGSATLQVTASAPTPRTFQWQFNGTDLTGTLTNVTLSDLGVYRVLVRDRSQQYRPRSESNSADCHEHAAAVDATRWASPVGLEATLSTPGTRSDAPAS